MRRFLPILFLAAAMHAQTLSDDAIGAILADRIDTLHHNVGIAVGIVDANGRRFVNHGAFSVDNPRPVAGDTLFEIGSITKVFTSTILADMVQRGEVSLDDPVAKFLPPDVKVPESGGKKITLVDLATHTSGLPRMPNNFAPRDPDNPYSDYGVDRLYAFLSGYALTRDIGEKFEYSNLGVGLLGTALARRAGMDYETLVRTRITGPLKMDSTGITLSAAQKARLAVGHNSTRAPVPSWDLTALAGAGAIRSDTVDMLAFVAAHLGYTETPLAKAMDSMTKVRRSAGGPNTEIGLAWIIQKRGDREIRWHNGGTGGYRSFVGYDPKARVGVVVLSNMSTTAGVDDIGMHLLDSTAPLAKLPAFHVHREITLDPRVLESYVGVYQLAPGVTFAITQEGARLFAQLTGQDKFEVYPETQHDFFYKVVDAQLTFEPGALVLHQNGRDQRAKRR